MKALFNPAVFIIQDEVKSSNQNILIECKSKNNKNIQNNIYQPLITQQEEIKVEQFQQINIDDLSDNESQEQIKGEIIGLEMVQITNKSEVINQNKDLVIINPEKNSKRNEYKLGKNLTQFFNSTSNIFKNQEMVMNEIPVNLKLQEDEYNPNYIKLEEKLKQTQIKKEDGQDYSCTDICVDVKVGCHKWKNTSKETDMDRFGIGISLYFRFLKYMVQLFLLLGICAIPVLIIYIKAGFNSKVSDYDASINQLLYYTTIGSAVFSVKPCQIIQINQTDKDSYIQQYKNQLSNLPSSSSKVNITVYCSTGTIDTTNDNNIRYGYITSTKDKDTNCINVEDKSLIKNQVLNQNQMTDFQQTFQDSCYNQSTCSFQFDILKDYVNTISQNKGKFDNNPMFYLKAYCKYSYVNLINATLPFNKQFIINAYITDISFIAGIVQCVIIIVFILGIYNLSVCSNKAKQNVIHHTINPSLFTIEVKNFNFNQENKQQIIVDLWLYFQDKLNEQNANAKIIDIQLNESNQILNIKNKIFELFQRKTHLTYKYKVKFCEKDFLPQECTLNNLRDHFDNNLQEQKKGEALKIIKELVKIENKIREQIELKDKIDQKAIIVKSAFITYEKLEQKNKILEILQYKTIDMIIFYMFNWGCFRKFFKSWLCVYENKILKISTPPDPSNILWKNIQISTKERLIRRIISMIIFLLIITLNFVFLAQINYQQNTLNQKYPSFDCSNKKYINISESDVISDYKSSTQNGCFYCYCSKNYKTVLNKEFYIDDNNKNKKICQDWAYYETIITAIPLASVLVILILNVIVQNLMELMTDFEKHNSLSSMYNSQILKIFVIQFINTAVVLIFVNLRLDSNLANNLQGIQTLSDIMTGKYLGLNYDWYFKVGVTLLLTMLIQVVSMPISSYIMDILKKILAFWDRGCSQDIKRTKKIKQSEYNNLYIGSQFMIYIRYAQIVTIIFVCFLFSTGMPLLYFTTAFCLFFVYWIDKFMLLRYCRIPSNIDEKIQQNVQSYMKLIIFIHILCSIFILGSTDLFNEGPQFGSIKQYSNQIQQKAKEIIKNQSYYAAYYLRPLEPQNWSLDILLAFMLLYFVFNYIFYSPIKKCIDCCLQNKMWEEDQNIYKDFLFYEFMKDNQINQELKMIKLIIKQNGDNIHETYKEKLLMRKNQLQMEIRQRKNQSKDLPKFEAGFSYNIQNDEIQSQLIGVHQELAVIPLTQQEL